MEGAFQKGAAAHPEIRRFHCGLCQPAFPVTAQNTAVSIYLGCVCLIGPVEHGCPLAYRNEFFRGKALISNTHGDPPVSQVSHRFIAGGIRGNVQKTDGRWFCGCKGRDRQQDGHQKRC